MGGSADDSLLARGSGVNPNAAPDLPERDFEELLKKSAEKAPGFSTANTRNLKKLGTNSSPMVLKG